MTKIEVHKFLNTAFGSQDAKILVTEIEYVLDTDSKIILDFSGITSYSALFFNLSLCKYMVNFGIDKYNDIFTIINMTDNGKIAYDACYLNTVRNPYITDNVSLKSVKELYKTWEDNEDIDENMEV